MPRALRLRWWVALAAAAAACGCRGEALRPDLLLVTASSLRADRLACYGGPADLGTSICSLGAQPGGVVRYEWAFTTAPSDPPAAASLLTSQQPSRHGVVDSAASFLPSRARSVAEELAAAGYSTAAFVGESELNRSRNFDQGFAEYDDRLERPASGPPRRSAADAVAAAIAWLDRSPAPRFAWVHFGDLRSPLPPPPIANYEEYEARYRETIREVDAAVARLAAAAERRSGTAGLGILFSATCGESIGEKGRWFTHGRSLALEQIRVPLLWRPPPPAATEALPPVLSMPVALVDAAPTLMWAAHLPAPASFEGEPLPRAPALSEAPTRPLFSESAIAVAVVAGHRYYVRERQPGGIARVAILEDGKALPAALPVVSTNRERTGADRLEELVSEFLLSARPARTAPAAEEP